MAIEVDGEIFAGRARARDILPCCVSAYIDALSNAQAGRDLRADRSEPLRLEPVASVRAA